MSSTRFVDPTLIMNGSRRHEAVVGSPVRQGHLPNAIRRRLIKALAIPRTCSAGWEVLHYACNRLGRLWLDHWGSTVKEIDGEKVVCLVSEPYGLTQEAAEQALRFAQVAGCRLQVDAASEWYPTHCLRLWFIPEGQEHGGSRSSSPVNPTWCRAGAAGG